MRVAIVGSYDWTDHSSVRRRIKELAKQPDVIVLLDGDPTDVLVAALRECRCSGIVPVQYHLPGNAGKRIIEMRARRDRVLFGDAELVVVFGQLSPDRAESLRRIEQGGIGRERRFSVEHYTTPMEPTEES